MRVSEPYCLFLGHRIAAAELVTAGCRAVFLRANNRYYGRRACNDGSIAYEVTAHELALCRERLHVLLQNPSLGFWEWRRWLKCRINYMPRISGRCW